MPADVLLTPEFLTQLFVQLLVMVGTGGALYGGIRTDLKSLHKRVDGVEDDVDAERKRMDNHLDRTFR